MERIERCQLNSLKCLEFLCVNLCALTTSNRTCRWISVERQRIWKKMQPNLENKQQHIWQFIKNPLILISFGCSAFVFHTKTLFCVEKEEVNHIKFYNNNDKVQHKEAGAKEELQPIHLIVFSF